MFKHPVRIFAIGAAAAFGLVTEAAAGCCPGRVGSCSCEPVVETVIVPPPPEMYVVNQGPVYSGPGAYVTQRNYIEGDQTAPYGYPPVGYVYSDTYVGGYRSFYSGNFYRGYSPYPYVGPGSYQRAYLPGKPARVVGYRYKPRMVYVAGQRRR